MGKKGLRKKSGVKGTIAALGSSVLICIVGVIILSELIYGETVKSERLNLLLPALLSVATLTGTQVNYMMQNKQNIYLSFLPAAVLAFLLLFGGCLFEGRFLYITNNIVGMGTGVLISCIICLKKRRNSPFRKTDYR